MPNPTPVISPTANPYAKFLDGRDPLTLIAATPAALDQLTRKLGATGLARPYAPGKWSAAQILCHLTDVEIAFAFRLRQALSEPNHTIQPFDQDTWSASYAQLDPHLALETFTALRNWNLVLIRRVSPDQMQKPVTHPERGQMTFATLVQTMAGHDQNHLRQLESIPAS
jgi:hypothetical protein